MDPTVMFSAGDADTMQCWPWRSSWRNFTHSVKCPGFWRLPCRIPDWNFAHVSNTGWNKLIHVKQLKNSSKHSHLNAQSSRLSSAASNRINSWSHFSSLSLLSVQLTEINKMKINLDLRISLWTSKSEWISTWNIFAICYHKRSDTIAKMSNTSLIRLLTVNTWLDLYFQLEFSA